MPPDVAQDPPLPAFRTVAVLGGGNGGKAVAADLALRGLAVRLFEWPQYGANIAPLLDDPVLDVRGVVAGRARLALVTTDLAAAVDGADLIVACVQGLAHARLATDLAPLLRDGAVVMLNPGSTGGALECRRIMHDLCPDTRVILGETGTLTHCARADGPRAVNISLRVAHIAFAALPGRATTALAGPLTALFPGLKQVSDVLEAALCNGNPVIHPAILLMNLGAIETRGEEHRFYAEGVTPGVARVIAAVDAERIALGRALGYQLMPEPQMSLAQGYACSADYYECYAHSPVLGPLTSPAGADHRYLHEDVGLGLVTYASLGAMLGVPTPIARGLAALAAAVTGRDYLAEGRRTADRLGLAGLDETQRRALLQEG